MMEASSWIQRYLPVVVTVFDIAIDGILRDMVSLSESESYQCEEVQFACIMFGGWYKFKEPLMNGF